MSVWDALWKAKDLYDAYSALRKDFDNLKTTVDELQQTAAGFAQNASDRLAQLRDAVTGVQAEFAAERRNSDRVNSELRQDIKDLRRSNAELSERLHGLQADFHATIKNALLAAA